jgi:hypothetical protein
LRFKLLQVNIHHLMRNRGPARTYSDSRHQQQSNHCQHNDRAAALPFVHFHQLTTETHDVRLSILHKYVAKIEKKSMPKTRKRGIIPKKNHKTTAGKVKIINFAR